MLTLSTETIATQLNDAIVPALVEQFNNILSIYKREKHSSTTITNDREAIATMLKIDEIVYNRFNIRIKTLFSVIVSTNAFIATIMPVSSSPVNRRMVSAYKSYVDDYNKTKSPKEYDTKEVEKLVTFDATNKELDVLEKNYMDSMAKFQEELLKNGVTIDLKEAKIHNTEDKYLIAMGINVGDLVANGLTAEEVTAIYLHEVGHIFTAIEYSYRNAKMMVVTAETVRNNSAKYDSSSEVIKLVYENTLNKKAPDGVSVVTMSREIISGFVNGNTYTTYNGNVTDAEQISDSFATRFGLGKELVTALDKITPAVFNIAAGYYLALSILILIVAVIVGSVLGGVLAALNAIMYITIYSSPTIWADHPDLHTRYSMIRNDIVKQIRTSHLDRDTLEKYISAIESIDVFISNTPKDEIKILGMLVDLFSSSTRASREEKDIDFLLAELMENQLHVVGAKFKLEVKDKR